MSILDRIRKAEQTGELTEPNSSLSLLALGTEEVSPDSQRLPAQVEEPPDVLKRIQTVFRTMIEYARNTGNPSISRFAFLIEAFFDEAVEEMRNAPPETVEGFFHGLSEFMEWIASGDINNVPDFNFPSRKALTGGNSPS